MPAAASKGENVFATTPPNDDINTSHMFTVYFFVLMGIRVGQSKSILIDLRPLPYYECHNEWPC